MAKTLVRSANIEIFHDILDQTWDKALKSRIIPRIWQKDFTVWKPKDEEISNRLGWLHSPESSLRLLPEIEKCVQDVRRDGYTQALLLGMGGSSLAPETLSQIFKTRKGFLDLHILDSTDPGAVLEWKDTLDPEKTLFIVSSKSGTTLETTSFLNFFFTWAGEALGYERAGSHFIAITDPVTPLAELARELSFRHIFFGDPEIGGRFSALSVFGLVPAALKGINIRRLLKGGRKAARLCRKLSPPKNPGVFLGGILSSLAQAGRDKATFIVSPQIESFSFWLEQLLAESTGKEGRGILPVVKDPAVSSEFPGEDRVFISIRMKKDPAHDLLLRHLIGHRQPLLALSLSHVYDLGSQFFLWEMAAAAAGYFLGINPFNQPDVAASKKKTEEILTVYRRTGRLSTEKPNLKVDGFSIFSGIKALSLEEHISSFLGQARPGDYLAIQAFLHPTQQNTDALQNFRKMLIQKIKRAVTLGFGPRYLHSTGQYHKGGKDNGLYIQFTADDRKDISIPDRLGSSQASLTFGILKNAQAEGDWEALKERGRRIMRIHIGRNVTEGLRQLSALWES
ncbi:MAG: hypothetical protein WCC06_06395 [Candidatus Aminicenantales bacterium]